MTIEDCLKIVKLDNFWKVNDIDTIRGVVKRIVQEYEECRLVISDLLKDE